MNALTAHDIAEQLSITPIRVYTLIEQGRLKAINVGSGEQRPQWRILPSDFDAFVTSRSSSITQPISEV